MGYLGYKFITLDEDGKELRRKELDHAAFLAQTSQLVVICAIVFFKLGVKYLQKDDHSKKNLRDGRLQQERPIGAALRLLQIIQWELGDEIRPGYGTIGQWLGGSAWSVWLAFLCAHKTTPGMLVSTCIINLLIKPRLSSSDQAIRYGCSFAASIALSPCCQDTIFTFAVRIKAVS
jgi:hypothetical protein